MPIRFHFDEHIGRDIAIGLRRRGIKVTMAVDIGLAGVEDSEQLAYAASTRSVMVTQDIDYVLLHNRGIPHTGIAFCPEGPLEIGAMVRALAGLHHGVTE